MSSKESPSYDFQQTSVDLASQAPTSIQTFPNILASASRPFLQSIGICTINCSAFDKMAKVELTDMLALVTEPMRTMYPCKSSAPPRRFYRTFWRSLTFRLWNIESIKLKANATEIQAQCRKQNRICQENEITLDIACCSVEIGLRQVNVGKQLEKFITNSTHQHKRTNPKMSICILTDTHALAYEDIQ